MGDYYQTVVVGAGCAGASVAYHLSKLGVKTLVLERGQVGKGLNSKMSVGLGDLRGGEESTFMPNVSGTNVFSLPTTTKIKMMVTLYASKSEEFIRHHGIEGAKKYLRLANIGVQTQKSLARSIFGKQTPAYLNELGSLYVCHEHELSEFKREFELLKTLVDAETSIEWWDKESVEKEHGSNSGFVAGIYFRNDAVIDSTKYAKELLNVAVESGHVKLLIRCSPVVSTGTNDGRGIVRLEDGTCFSCDHVIVATGAFYADDITGPLLRPCWSYLSAINSGPNHNLLPGNRSSKSNISVSNNTMNYFTFGFTHDWCISDSQLRISGVDHFSALKPPKNEERNLLLDSWVFEKYPFMIHNNKNRKFVHQYGVYSETPDSIMLLGTINDDSRVFYMCGCNAWGQAILSYAARVTPALLGYAPLSAEDKKLSSFLSVRRFSVLTSRLSTNKRDEKLIHKVVTNYKWIAPFAILLLGLGVITGVSSCRHRA